MAETIWWCEFHRAGGDPELDCWGAGLDGQDDCDMVERELIDPADLDYEAARRVMRSWLVEDNDAPLLSAVRWAVDAALGVREPSTKKEEPHERRRAHR